MPSLCRALRAYIAEHLLASLHDDHEMPELWRAEMDARVQRRECSETRYYNCGEVMADPERQRADLQ